MGAGPCQEQLPRIPAELMAGMELLGETPDDCAPSLRFLKYVFRQLPGFLGGTRLCDFSGTFGSPAELLSSE